MKSLSMSMDQSSRQLKIGAEQTDKVNLHGWKGFKIAKEHSNVVYFTFDQQKLGYYKR